MQHLPFSCFDGVQSSFLSRAKIVCILSGQNGPHALQLLITFTTLLFLHVHLNSICKHNKHMVFRPPNRQ